ncbi:hypothetical protein LEN26_015164 [Aphanomyces euteiches]|nr:hypothetical protein LEN26_015164 [Aphanomyces euteiches]
MELNGEYALHHAADSSRLKWAATIKLTPEVLLKLQQAPTSVSIRLDKTESNVLEVDGQRFELHSFDEDGGVNHLCTLTPDESGGYSFHESGRIAKKLHVMRMLDGQEKDRLKDRHAKSVQDSKARSSIVLESKPTTAKGRRESVLLDTPVPPTAPPAKKRRLESALNPRSLESIQKAIEKEELRQIKPKEPPKPPTATPAKKTAKKKTPAKEKVPSPLEDKAAPQTEPPLDPVEESKPEVPAVEKPDAPKLIRAKRRVLSPALNSLSTFTADIEAIFKKHIVVAGMVAPPPITSDEEFASCTQLHAAHMSDWTLLDKAYSVENVLHRAKAITGQYANEKYNTNESRRLEGMALLKNMLDQLNVYLNQLHAAILVYRGDQRSSLDKDFDSDRHSN